MATITFTLVLEVAFRPSSSSWPPSEEAVAALASLDLSGRGVAVIDNLEPFCDLRALNLSRNVIREVDNIYFLNKLEELDLSYNRISDIDCLRKSNFPRGLRRLCLDGNPFCADEAKVREVLHRLGPGIEVSALPGTGPSTANNNDYKIDNKVMEAALVGGHGGSSLREQQGGANISASLSHMSLNEPGRRTSREEEEGEEYEEADEEEGDEDDRHDDLAPVPPVYFDADALLREIVDRKCRIESLRRVDVNELVEALSAETDEISSRHARRVVERASALGHAASTATSSSSSSSSGAVETSTRPGSRHRSYEESASRVDRMRQELVVGGAAEAERDRAFLLRLRGQAGMRTGAAAETAVGAGVGSPSAKPVGSD